MSISRVLCALTFAFALKSTAYAQGGQAPPPPGPPPTLIKVKDDLFVLQNQVHTLADLIAYGGNATILLTDAGVLLIDSKSDREHDDLIAKIKTLTDKPVKYVVLTHNHADHTGGAAKLQAMGATLLISAEDRENMARGGQPGVPDLGYIGQAQVTLGGKTAELYQFRGHTRGDTAVYFPAQRVIVLGDLLTTAETIPPIVNYADGGTWSDWRKSIDQILRMEFDTVIPGRPRDHEIAARRDSGQAGGHSGTRPRAGPREEDREGNRRYAGQGIQLGVRPLSWQHPRHDAGIPVERCGSRFAQTHSSRYAFSNPAISSFFICIIAFITLSTLAGFLSWTIVSV